MFATGLLLLVSMQLHLFKRILRAIGLPVVTTGGEPVISDTGSVVFARDPAGLLLELIERR